MSNSSRLSCLPDVKSVTCSRALAASGDSGSSEGSLHSAKSCPVLRSRIVCFCMKHWTVSKLGTGPYMLLLLSRSICCSGFGRSNPPYLTNAVFPSSVEVFDTDFSIV